MAYVIIYSINVSQNAVKNIPRNISKEPHIATCRNVKRLNIGPLSRPGKEMEKFLFQILKAVELCTKILQIRSDGTTHKSYASKPYLAKFRTTCIYNHFS